MLEKFVNLDHVFFAKPIRRYLTLAICFGWGGFEASLGNWGWAAGFAVLGAIAFWQFRKVDWAKYEGGH